MPLSLREQGRIEPGANRTRLKGTINPFLKSNPPRRENGSLPHNVYSTGSGPKLILSVARPTYLVSYWTLSLNSRALTAAFTPWATRSTRASSARQFL